MTAASMANEKLERLHLRPIAEGLRTAMVEWARALAGDEEGLPARITRVAAELAGYFESEPYWSRDVLGDCPDVLCLLPSYPLSAWAEAHLRRALHVAAEDTLPEHASQYLVRIGDRAERQRDPRRWAYSLLPGDLWCAALMVLHYDEASFHRWAYREAYPVGSYPAAEAAEQLAMIGGQEAAEEVRRRGYPELLASECGRDERRGTYLGHELDWTEAVELLTLDVDVTPGRSDAGAEAD